MKFKEYRLLDIAELIGGGTPKTSVPEYWGGNIPWLSINDFNNCNKYVYKTEKTITSLGLKKSSTKILKKGDIIISARGTVGKMVMIPDNMTFNQSCYGLRAKANNINCEYLYYLLKLKINFLRERAHGSVFDTITRSTFESIDLFIPDIQNQNKMVKILSDIDKKIELNNKINNNLLLVT